MDQSGWSNQNGAESILGLGSHFVSVGSSESDGTDTIIIIYIVREQFRLHKIIYFLALNFI